MVGTDRHSVNNWLGAAPGIAAMEPESFYLYAFSDFSMGLDFLAMVGRCRQKLGRCSVCLERLVARAAWIYLCTLGRA